jgi:hypothetical protein
MKNLSQEDIKNLSFPDARVLDFVINNKVKSLLIRFDSAFVDAPEGGRRLQETTLNFTDFEITAALEFRDSAFSPIDAAITEPALRDVCEFVLDDDTAHLRGFSQHSGLWTELVIRYSHVEARTAGPLAHQDSKVCD